MVNCPGEQILRLMPNPPFLDKGLVGDSLRGMGASWLPFIGHR